MVFRATLTVPWDKKIIFLFFKKNPFYHLFHIIFDGQMVFLIRTDHFILTNAPHISGFIAQKSNKIMYSYERVWLFSQICEQRLIPEHFLFEYGF
jgi:hypothetical protein